MVDGRRDVAEPGETARRAYAIRTGRVPFSAAGPTFGGPLANAMIVSASSGTHVVKFLVRTHRFFHACIAERLGSDGAKN